MFLNPKFALATVAGLLVLSGSVSQAAGQPTAGPARLDLTASSHTKSHLIPDTDLAFRAQARAGVVTKADTTATTSATCDNCAGQAVSVHVLYLDRAPAQTLNNVAIAWAQSCTGCKAASVSLQVAVLHNPGSLTANNRALSLTAVCTQCTASAAAYQLVVAGGGQARLTNSTLGELRSWATDRAHLLRQSGALASLRTRVAKTRDLNDLSKLINADLSAKLVSARARLAGR